MTVTGATEICKFRSIPVKSGSGRNPCISARNGFQGALQSGCNALILGMSALLAGTAVRPPRSIGQNGLVADFRLIAASPPICPDRGVTVGPKPPSGNYLECCDAAYQRRRSLPVHNLVIGEFTASGQTGAVRVQLLITLSTKEFRKCSDSPQISDRIGQFVQYKQRVCSTARSVL